MFIKSLRISFMLWLVCTVLFGAVYPAAVTGIVSALFSDQAEGSLIKDKGGNILGSRLIGQNFSDAKYFWSRPSATSPQAYNATSSSGSNYGVNNPALLDAVKGRVDALEKADPANKNLVPVDLVTASGSGLDPHISPAAAYQIDRVAKARGMSRDDVQALVDANTDARQLGILGEPGVNVLALNLALDEKAGNAKGGAK